MQVILLEDIAKLGHKYEIKQVAAGFGRNWLLPQQKAVLATKQNLARYEKLRAQIVADRQVREDQLVTLLDKAEKLIVKLEAKANDQGHLFAGISAKDITEQLFNQHGLSIDPTALVLAQPLKTIGEHKVGLQKSITDSKPAAYLKIEITAAA